MVDEGYDVVYTNWRGVLAPGGISEAEAEALVNLITELHETEAWQTTFEEMGWTDAFAWRGVPSFLAENITRCRRPSRDRLVAQ